LETEASFKRLITAQTKAAEQRLPDGATGSDPGWTIGEKLRARGSLMSDSWTGPAVQLANRGQLALFPAMSWWRNRSSHRLFVRSARYCLLPSIEAPTVEEDLYVKVAEQIAAAAAVHAEIQIPGGAWLRLRGVSFRSKVWTWPTRGHFQNQL